MSVAMEIPDPPAITMCARCGYQKFFDRPCTRCGTMANRPRPVETIRSIVEGLGLMLLILAFSAGMWALTVWFALWFWSVV